jgi:hypothetical protein
MTRPTHYSAEVTLKLIISGRSIDCARCGPGYTELRHPEAIAAGTQGALAMTVDGKPTTWHVDLYRGATYDNPKVFFRSVYCG